MPVEATKSVGGAVEKLVQTGVDATQEVLGKSAGKIGRDLKKTPEKIKSFPGSLEKRLQDDLGAIRQKTEMHFKKDRS
jgi:hypothetical protein